MSEELIQRDLIRNPEKMESWNFYNIGSTTIEDLKRARIVANRNYGQYKNKKPDFLVVTPGKDVILYGEHKTPDTFNTPRQIQAAIDQELDAARKVGAHIFVATDGSKTVWINPKTGKRIIDESGNEVTHNFDKSSKETAKLIRKIMDSISDSNDQIIGPDSVDPLPLAKTVWQHLWQISGATPENCLYTFVEIFIFKYLSDLGILKGIHSFDHILSSTSDNSDEEVLETYVSVVRKKIKELFPKGDLDNTTIINGTIFVSKDEKAVEGYASAFIDILRLFKDFGSLRNIDLDFKSKLFETFLKESISKKNWGQYFTPLKVVRPIIKMADIRENMIIGDPACGVGKFLLEPVLVDISRFYKVENNHLVSNITLEGFDKGFDRDEQKTIILAKANMLIYLSGLLKENPSLTNEFAELFNKTFVLQTNSVLGTLSHTIKNRYDLILTNPPYVMNGSSTLKDEIKKRNDLKDFYKVNGMGVEGLFIEWIVRALKPGGQAFVIVPDGIMNRINDMKLRNFLKAQCYIDGIISLPLKTFFSTNKKTYILILTKKIKEEEKENTSEPRQEVPVFTYLCSEIGETRDVNRFEIEQNDLENATDLFNMFKGAKKVFKTEDPRCKIIPFEDFDQKKDWSVDRWWTLDEKVALGIEDYPRSVTLEGFKDYLNDLAATISEYEEPIEELLKKKQSSRYATVLIEDLFDFSQKTNGSWFTKAFVNEHSGDVPVYGATQDPNLVGYGYVQDKLPNVRYFEDSLTWNIDGSLGIFFRKGRFSLSEKVIPLVIKSQLKDQLNIDFLREAILVAIAKEKLFSFSNKGAKARFKKLKIRIPINDDGEYDLEEQNKVYEQLFLAKQLKELIISKILYLENIKICIPIEDIPTKKVPLNQILEFEKGKGKYTKKYGDQHKGSYPVWSSANNIPLTYIDTYDYTGPILSWNSNGFAGMMKIIEGPFSINGDRGILIPKEKTKLNLDYLRFSLEPIFRETAKGRKGDFGEQEFTKLHKSMIENIEVPIPITENGDFDVKAQSEIVDNYLACEQVRNAILKELFRLRDLIIDY